MKKIKYGLLSLLAIIGVASCDRNDYEYIPATDAGQASVSFPVDTETEVELKGDETEFNVLLTRTNSESKESLTLPLYASGDLTNEDGSVVYLEVPNSVTFGLQNEPFRVFFCIDKLVKAFLQTTQCIFQREIEHGSRFYFTPPHRFPLRNLQAEPKCQPAFARLAGTGKNCQPC